jgi:hypothetical protein
LASFAKESCEEVPSSIAKNASKYDRLSRKLRIAERIFIKSDTIFFFKICGRIPILIKN